MGDVSRNFDRAEFACNDGCGFDTVDVATVAILQHVREHFGRPVRITSGCRCRTWNAKVGGSAGSLHMEGRAADIVVPGVSPKKVSDFVRKTYTNASCKPYPRRGFTHIDTRTGKPWRP